jgi:hypothetical protein
MIEQINRTEEANWSKVQMDRLDMETRQDMMQPGLGPLRR